MDKVQLVNACRAIAPGRTQTFSPAEIERALPAEERPPEWTALAELYGLLTDAGAFALGEAEQGIGIVVFCLDAPRADRMDDGGRHHSFPGIPAGFRGVLLSDATHFATGDGAPKSTSTYVAFPPKCSLAKWNRATMFEES